VGVETGAKWRLDCKQEYFYPVTAEKQVIQYRLGYLSVPERAVEFDSDTNLPRDCTHVIKLWEIVCSTAIAAVIFGLFTGLFEILIETVKGKRDGNRQFLG
jgi:hypothetical protein